MHQESALGDKGYLKFESDPQQPMLEIARGLGELFEAENIAHVQTLVPKIKADELDNTYSGNFGLDVFPFHTDLAHWYVPPRYILLRCVTPAEHVATKLIDRQSILDEQMRDLINRAHFRSRKRLDRKTCLLKILHNKRFRSWFAPLSRSNLIRYASKRLVIFLRVDKVVSKSSFLRLSEY